MQIANALANIGIILIANVLINSSIAHLRINIILEFIGKVIAVSLVLVIFCGVLPKVWATYHKIWFAATASLIVEVFYKLFLPLSGRFVRLGDAIETVFTSGASRMDDHQLDY